MPHAVLKVNNLSGVVANDFHFSMPHDLQDRIMSMFTSCGLRTVNGTSAGHIKFEDYAQGVELHTLLNWIESSGYYLAHMSQTAVSQFSNNHTFVFKKTTVMDHPPQR
eukprot:CAMPEP_0181027292 /NCGR_PEP_ID=MMETSP1070-20121207/4088_1 /TAXON_ID=265543 /ORGANISM="Minutocellus polymorphus, Strain NH13" /LENGTH=107 /DNA_ID=CAMNT_0023104527 /DNA_START=90 /DNA_END=413 /DNA_ORIENTATION=+